MKRKSCHFWQHGLAQRKNCILTSHKSTNIMWFHCEVFEIHLQEQKFLLILASDREKWILILQRVLNLFFSTVPIPNHMALFTLKDKGTRVKYFNPPNTKKNTRKSLRYTYVLHLGCSMAHECLSTFIKVHALTAGMRAYVYILMSVTPH